MQLLRIDGDRPTQHFDSTGELYDYLTSPQSKSPWSRDKYRGLQSQKKDKAWSGSESMEQSLDWLLYGWPEGRKKMIAGVDALAASQTMDNVECFSMDVAGAYPIAAIAATGAPDSMVNPAPVQEQVRGVVDLYVGCSVSCLYSGRSVQNFGIALASHIQALEINNYRVQITLVWMSKIYNGNYHLTTVRVKNASEPLDLDKLAFCVGNPSFSRRLMFACFEACNKTEGDRAGYGQICTPKRGKHIPEDSLFTLGPNAFDKRQLSTVEGAFEAIKPNVTDWLMQRFGVVPKGFYTVDPDDE